MSSPKTVTKTNAAFGPNVAFNDNQAIKKHNGIYFWKGQESDSELNSEMCRIQQYCSRWQQPLFMAANFYQAASTEAKRYKKLEPVHKKVSGRAKTLTRIKGAQNFFK